MERAASEIKYQTTRACTPQDGSWTTSLIQTLWDPQGVSKCAVDTGLETAFTEAKRTASEMSVTYNFIVKSVQVGTAMVCGFGASTYRIVDGRNNNEITKFITKTVRKLPGLKQLIPSSDQLAIENRGGKRKSNKTRKGKKSSKARKGKKARKSKKARKA